jgi:hypothetical protein
VAHYARVHASVTLTNATLPVPMVDPRMMFCGDLTVEF